jgi:hypothetical protein
MCGPTAGDTASEGEHASHRLLSRDSIAVAARHDSADPVECGYVLETTPPEPLDS